MDLKRAGLSSMTVAIMVDRSKSTVLGWKNLDAEPRHLEGERLVLLWCQTTGLTREQLPVEPKAGERPHRRIHPVPEVCPCCGDPAYTPRVRGVARLDS